MILWLLRHPRTAVPEGVCYGRSDVELEPRILEESDELVSRVREAGSWELRSWNEIERTGHAGVIRELQRSLEFDVPLASALRVEWKEGAARLLAQVRYEQARLPAWIP